MRNNKGLGLIEVILLLVVVIIFLVCLCGSAGIGAEAEAEPTEHESIVSMVDAHIEDITTETMKEPEYAYISANYGPEAGVVKEIPLKEQDEEETTEVSPEFEQLVIEKMQEEPKYEPPANLYNLSLEDQYLLTALAWCEAGTEDIEGKALVINVVLNRVADPRFPDTVHDVVYQSGQFTPAMTGQLSTVAGDSECWGALDMVNMEGWDESNGAIYFCATYCDFSGWADFLFQHGGHKFYK
ncbi:MAG: cell wall hydrolase [Eubacterium sp.]|nr:cell wall hydrolase [Eubacterium sp.]